MKITITDLYCSSNRGDAAILNGMVNSLTKYFPEAEIVVLSYFPEVATIINKVPSDKPLIETSNLTLTTHAFDIYLNPDADGVSRILVPPMGEQAIADAIVRLCKDRELRVGMGMAGREFVENGFNVEREVGKLSKLFQNAKHA